MSKSGRNLLIALGCFLLVFSYIGYDLAQLQAGLEAPNAAVLSSAEGNTLSTHPAPAISTYEKISVEVAPELTIDVQIREAADATANIFLVHGAGGGAWVWEEYFAELPATYNLYAISWRGHYTSSPVQNANVADYVTDQLAVLAEIQARNGLPTHIVGHSYGGATSVLTAAEIPDQVASIHLVAPVVPLDYTVLQRNLVPLIMRPILANALETELADAIAAEASGADTQGSGSYAKMFIDYPQMERYWDLHAAKPYSVEKPGLIGGDGLDPAWQLTLEAAYAAIDQADIPVWFLIARYDNVIIPSEQRETALEIGADYTEFESGHYIQLDSEATASAAFIANNLATISQ